jgi:hypothetical protein
VAIGNSRLLAFDGNHVSFKWKDYRSNGVARRKVMTLNADEFMRRFLLHVLPDGFHRIRHYGLFANAARKANVKMARRLLEAPAPVAPQMDAAPAYEVPCPCCGGRMLLIEQFARRSAPMDWAALELDTS